MCILKCTCADDFYDGVVSSAFFMEEIMYLSLALIFILGILSNLIFKKIKLPSLIGMILSGIIIGPHVLNLIEEKVLNISAELRTIALIIILTRAGLTLNLEDLKKAGIRSILMAFMPASFEILGITIFAHLIFRISLLEAALLGSVLAAVSPAVVVPRMIKIIEKGYGNNKAVGQMILAASSVDDIYVIVIFTSILSLFTGTANNAYLSFVNIPVSIILGAFIGYLTGIVISKLLNKIKLKNLEKSLFILAISMLLYYLEMQITSPIKYSSLISIMAMGMTINMNDEGLKNDINKKYNNFWSIFEIFLFTLVGASINISYAKDMWLLALLIITIGLAFRMLGVFISLISSDLNKKEKTFSMLAYLPKATVQAAIGGVALSYGLDVGDLILSVAVVSILYTAPLGALLIDKTYKKFLEK